MKTNALALVSAVIMTFLPAYAADKQAEKSNAAESRARTLSIRRLDSGTSSGIRDCRKVVVRTQRDWARLWRQHTANGRPAPAVDFSKEIVLAVFGGTKNTGGHRVSIDEVTRHGKRIHVAVTSTTPGKDGITTQAQTQPFDIVAVPTSSGAVRWKGDPCRKL